MGIKYDKRPADTLVSKAARDFLASKGIQTGTRPVVDQKGRTIGTVPTVSFGNPIPTSRVVLRDRKGRVTEVVPVVKGFFRD